MKTVSFLFIVMTFLIPLHSASSQTLMDYVLAQRGDTLVIKDYADMENKSNSLYKALLLDTANVPAGRIYMLKTSGYYPLVNNPTTVRPTVIVGENSTPLVNNHNAGSAPPLICGSAESIVNTGGITAAHNLTIKNCTLVPGANDGSLGWAFAFTAASGLGLVFDNCIMERNRWIFVGVDSPKCNVTFRNCYFVNMTGQPCRRSGGLSDCFANLDTLLFENCTSIMACGSLFRFRSDPVFSHYSPQFKRIIINHNTFINCAGYVFMNPGCQSNMSLTNNIFVNSNIQSYPGIHSIDQGEQDPDWLPMGLVNAYPDSTDAANNTPRKILCQNNLAYWDPSLANMDSILDANHVNGVTNWRSQMIIMNARTDSMFKHIGRFGTTPYSFLVTDTWKSEMPAFTDSKDLSTAQLAILKTYALGTVDTAGTALLPAWRLINTGSDKFVFPDWPIPVDLSYSNADLLAGGIGGYPLGDLNWFPTRKLAWMAQRVVEYESIESAMQAGHTTAVKNVNALATKFALEQNYPNPFNPSTTISFSLPHSANASLRVFDMLGREVTTLLNGYTTSGMHEVQFNAGNLASGIYFYRLTSGNLTEVKKLMLMK